MDIEIREAHIGTVLVLRGRLDVSWSDSFLETALECIRRGKHQLFLDARDLEYISSAGIRVLLIAQRELAAVQGRLQMIQPPEFVERVLRMSGLGELIDTQVDLGNLDAALGAGRSADSDFLSTPLDAEAAMTVAVPCMWKPWGRVSEDQIRTLAFGEKRVAIGIGAPGADPVSCRDRFGECVAVCGCVVWRPTDGADQTDYLIWREQFVPELHGIQMLIADGDFSHTVRFQSDDTGLPMLLSHLVSRAMEQTQVQRMVMVCLAEVDGLVGVALDRSPGLIEAHDDPGAFPEIRDWLTFCGERLHARQTAIVVAFASRSESDAEAAGLVRLSATPGLWGHAHSVVMPHRPLPSGEIDLQEFVTGYFNAVAPLDVLHLIDDHRSGGGLGESGFVRGVCWVAPWQFAGEGEAS